MEPDEVNSDGKRMADPQSCSSWAPASETLHPWWMNRWHRWHSCHRFCHSPCHTIYSYSNSCESWLTQSLNCSWLMTLSCPVPCYFPWKMGSRHLDRMLYRPFLYCLQTTQMVWYRSIQWWPPISRACSRSSACSSSVSCPSGSSHSAQISPAKSKHCWNHLLRCSSPMLTITLYVLGLASGSRLRCASTP